MLFKNVEKQANFPKIEENILNFWHKIDAFKKSLDKNRDKDQFVFYDGPPFATGLPHYGHILPGTIKDIIPRYQTMKGKYVERVWGWDCHGLPVENLIEKELSLNSKKEIEAFGIDKFNEACRASVLRYVAEWEKTVDRMGRWVDFKNAYLTMNPLYMESIWWVFKTLWDKKLIYEGFKILPYCYRCATPLSNFETNQGYKDVQDPAITVAFKLKDKQNSYVLAWTTTPWTLPSNLALAVGDDIDYITVEDSGNYYIFAKALINRYYKKPDEVKIVKEQKGRELVGLKYEPLFPYFKELEKDGAFKIVIGHHVSTESGTGVVHIAPGFGEDDAEIGRANNLPVVCPVDEEGKFTSEVSDYKGINVKEADKTIIKRLKDEKKLIKHETYQHSYPHCWRCDEPLIYRAVSSWFVNIQSIKENMIEANQKINWIPAHLKEGRFGKWLEQARDWAISRNRYWGCPIPVWKCDSCDNVHCIGSISELEKLSGQKVTDLHKHFVDPITFKCNKCGGTMKRIEEVLDCWFESGAMPYAQSHYPFENRDKFEATYPADFIAESLDQTRGWFYTLVVLGAALFNKNAFKNVVVSGLVLAEDGKKMSKRLRNYPEVDYIFDQYGADALRLYLMNSAVVKAGELFFSEDGVKEVLKSFHLPLWNAYSFLVTYANVDGWDKEKDYTDKKENPLDIWLASLTEKLILEVDTALTEYDLQKAVRLLYRYLDDLTNWYIRRSRRRFWKSENDLDKKMAYSTLYDSLLKLVLVASPITPFISEEIYQNLKKNSMAESVHLCDYPQENKKLRNYELEREMELIMKTAEMGRSIRAKVKINLRRPLKSVILVTTDPDEKRLLKKMEDIVKEELNVKEVIFEDNEEKLVTLSCKPNFKVLGKKIGKHMKKATELISNFTNKELNLLSSNGSINIDIDGESITLTTEDVAIEREAKEGLSVMNEGTLTVALDTHLTKELIEEGIARQFIRYVQNLRKEKNLDVMDRIYIYYNDANSEIESAIASYLDLIKSETLSVSVEKSDKANIPVEIEDTMINIELAKI